MYHNSKAVVALSKTANDTLYQKTLGLNDFYFGAPDYDFPIGNIQMVGKSNAEAMKGEEPHLTKLAPHWTLADDRSSCRRLLAHHRGSADSLRTASRSPRTATSDCAYRLTNNAEADRLYDELRKILNHVGHGQAPRACTRISTPI